MNNNKIKSYYKEFISAVTIWFDCLWENYLKTLTQVGGVAKVIEDIAVKILEIFTLQFAMLVGLEGRQRQITYFVLVIIQLLFWHSALPTTLYALLVMQQKKMKESEIELNKKDQK